MEFFFLIFFKWYCWRQTESAFSITGEINWDTFATVPTFAFIGSVDVNKEILTTKLL